MSRRSPSPAVISRASSILYLPGGAETLVLPDGPIGSPAAELLGDIVNPQHRSEATSRTLVGESDDEPGSKLPAVNDDPETEGAVENTDDDMEERQEEEERKQLPFYRRPSAWWVMIMMFMGAIAVSTTIAPRVEVYTKLVCQAMRPEYAVEILEENVSGTVPPPSKMCGKDPDVQGAVAKLITIMTVSSGLLACLTTGWWGQLSDRHGRTRILGIATVGILATDVNFILVSLAANKLPGGYRFLLVGPIADGFLGGMTTVIAGLHAYISDCTPPAARSRIFSLVLGLLFSGMALGPTLGGLLVRSTNDLLSVFYLATASHLFYGCVVWFILPESLTKASMRKAKKRRRNAAAEVAFQAQGLAIRTRLWNSVKNLFGFLAPLSIFLPFKRVGRSGWDWNLTLMVLSYGCVMLLMGSYQFKFQYAQKVFGWDSEAMGYWLSVIGVVRAVHLVVILPLIIRYLKPKVSPIQLPVSPSEPLHPTESLATPGVNNDVQRAPLKPKDKHSAVFDVALARVSLGIELICYAGMAMAGSSTSWTVATLLGALGGGFSPAMQSVALALYERGPNQGIETGRLFGGLSVVQALSTQILGPSLFGLTYVSTVNAFPQGIFVVATGAVALSLLFTSLLRLSDNSHKADHDREETAVEFGDGTRSPPAA